MYEDRHPAPVEVELDSTQWVSESTLSYDRRLRKMRPIYDSDHGIACYCENHRMYGRPTKYRALYLKFATLRPKNVKGAY